MLEAIGVGVAFMFLLWKIKQPVITVTVLAVLLVTAINVTFGG